MAGDPHTTLLGAKDLVTPDWAVVTELPWEEAYRPVIWQAVWSVGIALAMAALAAMNRGLARLPH